MTLSLDSLLMPYSDPAATQQRRYLPQDLSQGLTQDAGTLLGAPTTVPGFPSSAMPQTAQSPIPAPGTMDQVGQQLDQRLGELNTQTQGAQPPPLSNPLENLLAPSLMGQMGQTGTMPGMPTTPGAGLPTAGGAGVTGQDVPSTGYTGPGSVPGHYNYGGTDPLYNGNPGSYTQYGLNPKDLETIAGKTMVQGGIEQLRQAQRDLGIPILANIQGAGFRTHEEQAAAYQRYLSGHGALAAQPYHSMHEAGRAVDINSDFVVAHPEMRQWLDQHGWVNAVPGEVWHWEYTGPATIQQRTPHSTPSYNPGATPRRTGAAPTPTQPRRLGAGSVNRGSARPRRQTYHGRPVS